MKSILNLGKVLILSLILWGCNPDMLQISDASEIQFWRTGEQTSFNLEEEGYTDKGYCFNQKFLCTSQRKFQGIDTDNETLRDYFLIAFDEDGAVLFNQQFDFFQETIGYPADIFEPVPFDDWNNSGGVGEPWTLGSLPSVTISPGVAGSEALQSPAMLTPSGTFDVNYHISNPDADDVDLYLRFYKNSVLVDTYVEILPGGDADISGTITVTLAEACDQVKVEVVKILGSGDSDIAFLDPFTTDVTPLAASPKVYSLELTPSDESMCDKKVVFKIFDGADPETDNELYYTDEVEFVSVWANGPSSGRVVIQFKNIKNFAGLIYNESSSYFNLEIEGRFRKERKITSQKSIETSGVVLTTASTVKKQKKLTIDDVPDYMHTKICLALAHAASGSVLVNGVEISLEESYNESDDRPESYPLTPADIWLTLKNYYKHNII